MPHPLGNGNGRAEPGSRHVFTLQPPHGPAAPGAGASLPLAARLRAGTPMRTAPKGAPNIIFIMTDDQAQQALGIYGNPILKTPNMNRIGREGIRFDKAFGTTSVCAPSRASQSERKAPPDRCLTLPWHHQL